MITVGSTKHDPLPESVTHTSGLDNLIESLCESYRIPASKVGELKSGLTNTLYGYLSKFISDNNLSLSESIQNEFKVKSPIKNRSSEINAILESARVSGTIKVTYKDRTLVELVNESEQITYQLGQQIDIAKLNDDALLEAWKCSDIQQVRPLLESIFDQLRKE